MKSTILLASFLLFSSLLLFGQTSNPFLGFRFMTLPTNQMPIGALWNTNIGPVGNGVSSENILKSSSYSNLDLLIDKNLKTSIDLGILEFLNAKGGYNSFSNVSISVKKLERVTLNSLDILKANVGNQILYEGLRASEFIMTVDKDKSTDAQLNMMKIFTTLDFTVELDTENKTTIRVGGADLFIAYRVVEVESEKQNRKKLKFNTQGYSSIGSVTLSSVYEAITPEYAIQICPCRIKKCIKDSYEQNSNIRALFSKCAAQVGFDLTVILKNKMDMSTGKPQEYKYVIKNPGGSINNYNQSIYNNPTSTGLEVSYINFERLVYENIGNTSTIYLLHDKKYRNVSLITAYYTFKNIIPNSVPGW